MNRLYLISGISFVLLSASFAGGFTCGKNLGFKNGYAKGWSDKPQQVLTAPSTINNPAPSGYWYGVQFGKSWGIGVCHK